MRQSMKWIACAALLFAAPLQAQVPIAQEDMLAYLDEITQWQRDMAGIEATHTNPREAVFVDALRGNALKALQSSFTFERSMAGIVQPATPATDADTPQARITKRLAEIDQHLAALKAQQRTASGTARANIAATIRLEQARRDLAQTVLSNISGGGTSTDTLSYTVDSLSRSIPELNGTAKPADKDGAPPVSAASSILSLSGSLFDITRKQRDLKAAIAETETLKKHSQGLMKGLRSGLGDSDQVSAASIDARIAAFKQLGASIVPLAETMRWIDASEQTLGDWNSLLDTQFKTLLRQLAIRTGFLLAALAIPVLLSELARRPLRRVKDPKRFRQLNTARRIITGLALVLILLLNFISDFSSFATFAGFMTAGLAVALQSVLLSFIAHFMFYGRYGVRAGDKVNVAGVTGEILQVGLLRFYMREIKGSGEEAHITGKIVAFPNSILFQNTAFYKYTD